jgi:polyisoprenyl-teichoic acid--peptidoglycan teichoic acid transferase
MTGPGPLDDWSAWSSPPRQLRPSAARGQASRATGRQEAVGNGHSLTPQDWANLSVNTSLTPTIPMRPLPGQRPLPAAEPRKRRTRRGRIISLVLVAAVLLLAVFGGLGARRLYAFGQAISPQSPLSSQTGFMSGSQRVNVVIMGFGGTGHDGAYLTDSMMVMSVVPSTGSTTLISVPRDLWVQVPPNSGQYSKINTAYQDGLYNGYDGQPAGKLAGGAMAAQKISDVTGLDVKYWVTIDFTGFRKLVDAFGGVTVNVPTAFTANYPINDDPSINAGWKVIHFNAGPQHMNGEQAIEYARARYVIAPASEGTDFARSARQQLLIHAILARARQPGAWPGLLDATNALQQAMYSNLSLADLMLFAQKMNMSSAHRIGLSNQNVLVDAVSNDGQDILQPQNGDWSAVRSYVAQQLAP